MYNCLSIYIYTNQYNDIYINGTLATAFPIPWLPPVMMTWRPANFNFGGGFNAKLIKNWRIHTKGKTYIHVSGKSLHVCKYEVTVQT